MSNQQQQQQQQRQEHQHQKQHPPFESIMENVVFVLSGYQNPRRTTIRDQALKMGAKYRQNWDESCTHLV